MQRKSDLYADKIFPLVDRIAALCAENDIPMLMAFCLDVREIEDGKSEMVLAGSTHLDGIDDVPNPMMLAASLLHIPGFELTADDWELVH